MKLEKFKITGVNKQGIVKKGGSVNTKGGITIIQGGCSLNNCHCSDGYSITLTLPRNKKGEVEGIICKFDNITEMKRRLNI